MAFNSSSRCSGVMGRIILEFCSLAAVLRGVNTERPLAVRRMQLWRASGSRGGERASGKRIRANFAINRLS
jgi:hypothetical protein